MTSSATNGESLFPFSLVKARVLLGILTFIAFVTFMGADLFWDDFIVITPEGPIAELATIKQAFFDTCVLFPEHYNYVYYRPMIDILFILEYAIAGTHPFVYHLTNFLLHLGNALLAFEVFRRIAIASLQGRAIGKESLIHFASFLGAAIFALHPIQCESVLWAAARPAVLCTFFCQLALLALLSMKSDQSVAKKALLGCLSLLGFTAGLFSKEIAVAFVPIALLLLLGKGRGKPAHYIVMAIVYTVFLTVYLLVNPAASGGALSLGIGNLLHRMISALGFYFFKVAVPFTYFPFYPPDLHVNVLNFSIGVLITIVTGGMVFYCLWKRTLMSIYTAGAIILMCGSPLLPVLGLQTYTADRYMYQGMYGLGLLIVMVLLFLGLKNRLPQRSFHGAAVLLILLTILSLKQSAVWLTEDILWSHTIEKNPTNVYANHFMGKYFEKNGHLDRAVPYYEVAAFTERPDTYSIQFGAADSLGRIQFQMENYDAAKDAYEFAAQHPDYAASSIVSRAIIEYVRGDHEASEALLATVIERDDLNANSLLNIAVLMMRLDGDAERGAIWYRRAREAGSGTNPELEAAIAE